LRLAISPPWWARFQAQLQRTSSVSPIVLTPKKVDAQAVLNGVAAVHSACAFFQLLLTPPQVAQQGRNQSQAGSAANPNPNPA